MLETKRRRIGILTFHQPINFGSRLQAFALQKILIDVFKYDVEIIDFSNKAQRKMYSMFGRLTSIRGIYKTIIGLLFYEKMKKFLISFDLFNKKYLKLTKNKYYMKEQLSELKNSYDIIICGSDQIWNTKCLDSDDAYFIDFDTSSRKIAYATSLGATNILDADESTIEKYKKLLLQFKYISVRERNAKKWLSKMLPEMKIDIAVDPTMLLTVDEWASIGSESPFEGDYILWYSFHYFDDVNKTVSKISKETSLPVLVIDAYKWSRRMLFRYGFILSNDFGPEVFISAIKNAKLVITTSFHGTVFSALFEKVFWYIKTSINTEIDDRSSFLLEQLGLGDRYATAEEIFRKGIFLPIEYTATRNNLLRLRNDSMNLLHQYLDCSTN